MILARGHGLLFINLRDYCYHRIENRPPLTRLSLANGVANALQFCDALFPRQPVTDCLADTAVERRPDQYDFGMLVQEPLGNMVWKTRGRLHACRSARAEFAEWGG
jgi:hypothetical protein